jgi:peptidoglycan/LPS O-acetylase OafA/YrhL
MRKPPRFTFSLLRMLLGMAAIAAVLAVGRLIDAPPAPILATGAVAGLLMFVIQWRHLPALIFEGLCAMLGAGIASLFAPAVRLPRTEYSDLTYAVSGALIGWFIACCWLRAALRSETSHPIHGREPQTDAIEARPRHEPNHLPGDTSDPPRADDPA